MFICNFIDNIFILHAISTESGVNLYSTEFVDDEEDREKSPHVFFLSFLAISLRKYSCPVRVIHLLKPDNRFLLVNIISISINFLMKSYVIVMYGITCSS
jgi:hypothetical protein